MVRLNRQNAAAYNCTIRQNVYQRAGMSNSDSYWKNEDTPNLAKGYSGREGALHDNYDTRPMRGSPAGGSYGYGFEVSDDGGARSFGHGGGAPGINSDLKIFPGSGYVVVVMGNLDPPAASRVSDFIAARLPVK